MRGNQWMGGDVHAASTLCSKRAEMVGWLHAHAYGQPAAGTLTHSQPLACSTLAWLRVYRMCRWSSTQMSTRAAGAGRLGRSAGGQV